MGATVAFSDFPSSFQGVALRPDDAGYAEARMIHNARHDDQRPALIARCTDADDVLIAVDYAVGKDLSIAIRGGGHSVDGHAMPDGAFVVDCSPMKRVEVDPETGITRIEAGVLLGELDTATQAHGLAVPAGTMSTVGATGLILGGGTGYLTRRHGLSVDNVIAIDLVTVDGRALTATAYEHPDLFWGMCGAGHNLAVVTALTLQAHPVGPVVTSGLIMYPLEQAVTVLGEIDALMAAAPRELSIYPMAFPAPPLPELPRATIGVPVVSLAVVYTGDLDDADRAIGRVARLGDPLVTTVGRRSWLETNALLDAFAPPGRRRHRRGGYIGSLSETAAELVVARVCSAPATTRSAPGCAIGFPCLGGASADLTEDAKACSRGGGARWLWEAAAQWDDSEDDKRFDAWVEGTADALTAQSPEPSVGRPEKRERIRSLKARWDPANRLRHNTNIPMAPATLTAIAQSASASNDSEAIL